MKFYRSLKFQRRRDLHAPTCYLVKNFKTDSNFDIMWVSGHLIAHLDLKLELVIAIVITIIIVVAIIPSQRR